MVSWIDSEGSFWMFAGFGLGNAFSNGGFLNDVWQFRGNNWTWVDGSTLLDQLNNYNAGQFSIGGRAYPYSAMISGSVVVFGGSSPANVRLSDLWQFNPPVPVTTGVATTGVVTTGVATTGASMTSNVPTTEPAMTGSATVQGATTGSFSSVAQPTSTQLFENATSSSGIRALLSSVKGRMLATLLLESLLASSLWLPSWLRLLCW